MPHDTILEASHLGLRDLGQWLDQVFEAVGWSSSASRGAIELAIHEVAANVVDHARPSDGRIMLSATTDKTELFVRLSDCGNEFEPSCVVPPDPENPQVRGYGLMIVEQVATSLDYQRIDATNNWTMAFAVDVASDTSSQD